jgi:outer membrane protein assembly factor BamE (lipoprotein component of BamABCDE complex)
MMAVAAIEEFQSCPAALLSRRHLDKRGSGMRGVKQPVLQRMALAVLASSTLFLAGCGEENFNKGYVIDETLVNQVQVGDSAEKVVGTLGTPSTTSTVGSGSYYYISQQAQRSFAFQNPSVVDQRVLAIYFNKSNKVDRIANYGLKDGVLFDFLSNSTPTAGADQNLLSQIFGLFGRY